MLLFNIKTQGLSFWNKAIMISMLKEKLLELEALVATVCQKVWAEANVAECDFLTDFQESDNLMIVMCHTPVCWIRNEGINEWNTDIVFYGHVHGVK